MSLRPYQQAAVEAAFQFLREHEGHPALVLPTAAGKSHVIAALCRDAVERWHGRVLVVTHVRELIEQNADKIQRLAPTLPIGIYSAGLKSRDTLAPVIVAGIQSVYKRACELGAFDLILVDECHLIPDSGEGMYRSFLDDMKVINPWMRVIGLTATPYRMNSGPICGPDRILNAICYEIGVRELIRDGYLSPLITKAGHEKADTSQLHVRGGEFVTSEVEALMDDKHLVTSACHEIVNYTRDRKSCLIFASGVQHATHIAQTLQGLGKGCACVFGDTLSGVRDQVLEEFRQGKLKYLCNVNVLTTGFDAPNIDCIALMRPTLSPGLYYQMVGRGFRLHPGKANCLVLDFGGNVLRHGPVDAIRIESKPNGTGAAPAKECPKCHSLIATGFSVCPDCGYEFPPPERNKHDARATDEGILSGQVTITTWPVTDVYYVVHAKRGAPPDAPKTMRVEYQVSLNRYYSEWICFEHDGFARQKAEAWWRRRCQEPVPESVEEAVRLANEGALCATQSITVRSVAGEPFPRITDYELVDAPRLTPEPDYWPADDEIPF